MNRIETIVSRYLYRQGPFEVEDDDLRSATELEFAQAWLLVDLLKVEFVAQGEWEARCCPDCGERLGAGQ